MKEIWRDIKNYEGLYQVSNLGNVKSLRKNIILKGGLVGIGYYSVNLCKNKNHKSTKIHKLVAQTFIPNPNNYPCINHKDGNKTNNCVDNLEWCTHSYNNKEAYRIGLKKSLKGKNNYYSRTLMIPINQYSLDGNFIKRWNSISEASKELNLYHSNIIAVCKNKKRTAGGFIWKYAKT